MKRWMWILCGLLVFSLMEETGSRVEELQPVQLLQVTKKNGSIWLETDTNDFGRGDTLKNAMEDLQITAEKQIFLETADMLVLGENTESLLPELRRYLRPAVQVCRTQDDIDLTQAAVYLQNHRSYITLSRLSAEVTLPELKAAGGRLRLAGNNG